MPVELAGADPGIEVAQEVGIKFVSVWNESRADSGEDMMEENDDEGAMGAAEAVSGEECGTRT